MPTAAILATLPVNFILKVNIAAAVFYQEAAKDRAGHFYFVIK